MSSSCRCFFILSSRRIGPDMTLLQVALQNCSLVDRGFGNFSEISMTVKRAIFRATYPVFALVMKIPWVRQFFAKVPPFLARLVTPYYLHWYSLRVDYSNAGYQLYQAKYWDTVGQWRWAVTIDYSDMFDTLKRYIEERDRSLVELGCGTGAMLAQIRSAFPSLVLIGVDSAARMCAKAKKLVPTATIIHTTYGPALKLDPADIVIARSTLTYIDESDIS